MAVRGPWLGVKVLSGWCLLFAVLGIPIAV
jgi:hypothetical protein